jgi:hypothetical protein
MKTPKRFHVLARASVCSLVVVTILITLSMNSLTSAQNAAEASRINTKQAESGSKEEPKAPAKLAKNSAVNKSSATSDAALSSAPDLVTATTYPFSSASGVALEDMSSGTTQLVAANLDDNASAVTNIGFEFWYDGVRFTQFSVNANGLCRLGATVVSTAFDNSTGFNSTTNAPKIAPYFDDMWIGTNGKIHFKVTGVAPNRKLVVEWQNEQIPRVASGNAGAGTFQMWLFETSGVIEFVYGNGMAVNTTNAGYSIGLQSGAATNFASVTTSTNTVSYAAANNTQTNAIAAGTAYIFTPNVPAAPTGLNFTAVTPTSLTLNWTDNASNEFGYVIYQSTDGINYTFVTQTAANATSFAVSGLNPGTTYFFNVYAVSEGALSAVLSGSQATAAPGVVNSTATGGNWSAPATWSGGVVPTAGDNVTIADGATVTVDVAANALNLTIGTGGTPAVLQYEATTARTLAVGQSVTIATNGTLQSAATGTVITHVLSVGVNLTNNGVLDFSTNGNTAGAGITFTTANNGTFSGTGATTDIRTITVNKGTSSASTIEVMPTNLTVQGVTTDVAGYLVITNGTFKISGTFTMTNRTFTTATYTIPATGGIWLNNSNYTVAPTASSTTTNQNGLFRITQGTYNIGLTAADGLSNSAAGGVWIIEGGAINSAGRIDPQSALTWTQSGGTITVGTVGNTRSNFGTFELFSTSNVFNMSGGTITIVQASTGATPVDYRVSGTANVTGGTLNLGTGATVTNFNFRIAGNVPNLFVTNTTNNKTATQIAQTNLLLNTTINTGATYNLNGFVMLIIGPTVTNNGTITATLTGSRFYLLGNGPQTYTGTGTATLVTASGSVDLTMDNPAGLTIDPASGGIITQRVNFFRGGITNSNKLTLGNGGATVGVIQYGLTGGLNTAGNFDVAPTFNIGTGGETLLYAQEPTPRTTGVEVNPTRIVAATTINNTNGVTLGTDLSVTFLSTSVLTLTAGNFNIGANTLTLNNPLAGTATNLKGGPTSSLVLNGTTAINVPSSITALNNFTLNNAAGSTLQGPLAIGGTLTLQNGALSIGANELAINGPLTVGTGTLTGGATSSISVGGAGASITLPAVSGGLIRLTLNRVSGLTLGAPLNVGVALELFNGTLNNATNNVTLGNNANITVAGGSLAAAPVFGTTVNVTYLSGLPVTTGFEIPASPTVLNNLTVIGPGNVLLSSSPTVNGVLALNGGNIVTGANVLIISATGSVTRTAGFVDGNLARTFTAPGSKTYDVGAGGVYSPATVNAAALSLPSAILTVKANNQPIAGLPAAQSLQRNWAFSSSAVTSATLQFAYAQSDVPGTANEAQFRIVRKRTVDQRFTFPNGMADNVDEALNTATTAAAVTMPDRGGLYTLAQLDAPGTKAGDPRNIELFDFDGLDGRTDVAIWNGNTGNWSIINSATNTSRVHLDWGRAALGDILVPGDYDGDTRTDLAVWRPSDGNWYVVKSTNGLPLVQNWGQAGDKPVVGDFDGDGITDLAVFRSAEGNWYVKKSSGGSSVQGWGTAGDKTVPADYDGDGKTDLAVFRPSDNNWYILNSATNTSTVMNWGLSGDTNVQSDYDGDGRADIAVWRSSEGNWYIRNSSDGSGTVRNWGNSDDVPVAGDYDRDGRTDIAVYRDSEANFYIIRSSDGNVTTNLTGKPEIESKPAFGIASPNIPVASAPHRY